MAIVVIDDGWGIGYGRDLVVVIVDGWDLGFGCDLVVVLPNHEHKSLSM
jgi:hypothetical protein